MERAPPSEPLPVYLRGYVHTKPRRHSTKARLPPGEWTLVFDTETTVDPAQRLRIGSYQLLKAGALREQGLFFEPEALDEEEVACLRVEAARAKHRLRRRGEFIEEIIFKTIYETGGTIVGFNLPFDLSRLARSYDSARGNMKGGFTFELLPGKHWPRLRVKHVSRRIAFIDFAAPGKQSTARSGRQRGEKNLVERGTFLDLATLAAALTSSNHTLKSLASLLGTNHQKSPIDDFGRRIDAELIAYAINDVQVTRECWEALIERYTAHAETGLPPHAVFSEASIGKAYLTAMGIRPWREMQPSFPPELIGAVMSAYYGGRAEVHRRREVVRTIYCDFASMYPTVCTLMGLWRFVIAQGVNHEDATEHTRAFLAGIDITALQDPRLWSKLTVLVEVEPDADIFPVRARYGDEPVPTIGVNYLTSSHPLWFTLADCVASKLLTGKAPRVKRAVHFCASDPQTGLQPVALAGDKLQRVDPLSDDFYRRVIDLRRSVQRQAEREKDTPEGKRLDAHQLALKILANATSYGIFIELNVEDLDRFETANLFEADQPRAVHVDRREAPGRFFHPLLATLITGAARLLLAVAERKLLDADLDWAFCDTDSMAFAKPADLAPDEFERRVREVCTWFKPLDPFENKGEVLEIEKQNYVNEKERFGPLHPLFCFAISAKRYALFNHEAGQIPTLRKASGHGLGHLLAPYDDPDRKRYKTGVPVWQEDFWCEIVKVGLARAPDSVNLAWHPALSAPAASQYTATAPDRLRPFSDYNRRSAASERVRPFNFLLWFHPRRPEELVIEGHDIEWSKRTRTPKPVAAYDKDPGRAAKQTFDRETREGVSEIWLKSYARTLRTYARHPETKFAGGEHGSSGALRRRHVFAGPPIFLGKEADRWEEDGEIGVSDDSAIEYDASSDQQQSIVEQIRETLKHFTHRQLARAAHVSEHTISELLRGDQPVRASARNGLLTALHKLDQARERQARDNDAMLSSLREEVSRTSVKETSIRIGCDPSNLRQILAEKRAIPKALAQRLIQIGPQRADLP